jgi:predicted HTH domain antitoxin
MKEEVTLNRKEQRRMIVLNQIETKRLTVDKAAMLLEVTPRHVWRLLGDYWREGTSAMAYGNRVRKSPSI